MGILAKITRNGMVIEQAYLMVGGVTMNKFMRPVFDPSKGEFDMVPAVGYTAQVQIYFSQEQRMLHFGETIGAGAFIFDHDNGMDPVHEAYAWIHARGLQDWTLNDLEDVL